VIDEDLPDGTGVGRLLKEKGIKPLPPPKAAPAGILRG
jgi:hypothetical protein